jgi:hypothetical protein
MLERIALHQTRLRTPGLGLDARGVALGTHGLFLFPSLDRLVAFLAVHTESQTFDDLAAALRIELVESRLGAREVVLIVPAESSDRMDGLARAAALVGAHAFTGGGSHWVQYRDAAAPFGYDLAEVSRAEGAYVVHHQAFTQAYERVRAVDLRALVLRLSPRVDPSAGTEAGPRYLLAESGVGAALVHYLRRSEVESSVGVVEWPPASPLEDEPIRRHLFHVPALPARMSRLTTTTPGIKAYVPVAEGAAVEVGHRHPLELRALPSFRGPGLVLFHGRGERPLEIERLPAMASVRSLARVEIQKAGPLTATSTVAAAEVRVRLRLLPSPGAIGDVRATFVPRAELPQLRKMAYVLGPESLRQSRVALTEEGAFVLAPPSGDVLPVGRFYRAVTSSVFVPAGYETVPKVAGSTLASALDVPAGHVILLSPDGPARALREADFVPLDRALLEGPAWAPLPSRGLPEDLLEELPEVTLSVTDPGAFPLGDLDGSK